ncbi:MAG: glycosyl hydrolase family 28 protein [Armatimonadota bacterium]
MSTMITWPAPAGEVPSPDYIVEVDGNPLFVYQARVRAEILQNDGLWTHRPDCTGERASFALCDTDGPIEVTVRTARQFHTAAVLPDGAGIVPRMIDGGIRFTLDQPRHLTVLFDDDDSAALHLFISEPETEIPQPDDPNVLYFGPGVHEIETLTIQSGQTVYLAGGAVLQAKLKDGDEGQYSEKWKVTFYSGVVLDVNNATDVRICGRGILDGSLVPHPGRNLVCIRNSADVRVEGITLRDSPNWNMLISQSHDVRVENVRVISGRLNSDGINSVNSQRVQIRKCFVRNHDDTFAVKTTAPTQPAEDILVEDCLIWNDWGYALGATYETRMPIQRVTYRRCAILSARHWCMGIHVSDSATISDITFTDIEIAALPRTPANGAYAALTHEPKLLRMVVTEDCWGHDPERGRIRNITLDGVTQYGECLLASELFGLDDEHDIRQVTLRNIGLHGHPPASDAAGLRLESNEFVREVRIEAGSVVGS